MEGKNMLNKLRNEIYDDTEGEQVEMDWGGNDR